MMEKYREQAKALILRKYRVYPPHSVNALFAVKVSLRFCYLQ
jgi:hypothetical protein